MTHRIAKSRVAGTNFEADVQAFASEMGTWKRHMAKVGVDPQYVAYPRPSAAPDVLAAIRQDGENFVPDFEVVDDSPPPEAVLRQKKDLLLAEVMIMERAAAAAVVPLGKRRLLSMKRRDVAEDDRKLLQKILGDHAARRETVLQRLAKTAKKILTSDDVSEKDKEATVDLSEEGVAEEIRKRRPEEQTAFLKEQEEHDVRLAAIERHAAELQHDIEDLTVETVDGWKPTPFPT